MSDKVLTVPRDQWGQAIPLLGRAPKFADATGLQSPAQTGATGELDISVPAGATQLHVCCDAKGLKVGGADADLSDTTAGGFVNVGVSVWLTLFVADVETIKVKTSDASQQIVSFYFDHLGEQE